MKEYELVLKNHIFNHANIITYPDGQRDVSLNMCYFDNPKYPVVIKCQIKRYDDFELLFAAFSALHGEDFIVSRIDFIYLMGMRSDRKFEMGHSNYFRDVIANLVKAFPCDKRFLELHGRCREIMYIPSGNDHVYYDIYKFMVWQDKIVIAGDESAIRIACMHGTHIVNNIESTLYFEKKRLSHNELKVSLSDTFIETIQKCPSDTILIIDDLCDGGATFIEEAKYLKKLFPDKKLHLYVTHGLFTKGVDHVAAHFDCIYTTNSYQEFTETDKLKVYKVI